MQSIEKIIVLGKIVGIYGVQGWLRIFSYTEPPSNILQYNPWLVACEEGWRSMTLVKGRAQGKSIVAQLEGYADRDNARSLMGAQIGITRAQLPPLRQNEYYWSDLEGMRVIDQKGVELGIVKSIFATGSNDVLVVQGEKKHLVPFLLQQVILNVDCDENVIYVTWDSDF